MESENKSAATDNPDQSGQPRLRRHLGILNATSINMSNMVGIGPFITIPLILGAMGGPQALICWFVGAFIALADGLVVSELGAAIPGSGGAYVFLRDSFGKRWGRLMAFLFIWQFFFVGPLEIASGNIGLVQYLGYFWPAAASTDPILSLTLPFLSSPFTVTLKQLIAAGVGGIAVFALYRKITDIAKIMLVLWITMLVTTGWIIVTGLIHFNPSLAFDFPPGAFNLNFAFIHGLGAGSLIVMYNFLGYYQVCYLGDEVKQPERTIPAAVILSIMGVLVVDFLVSFAFVGAVPWRDMLDKANPAHTAVASVFMENVYGEWAGVMISIMIVVTAFGSIFALMLGYSRIPFAAARDGNFFAPMGKLHPKGEFPHLSLLVIGGLCIVASFFSLENVIAALMAARILIQFIGHTFGLFVLRHKLKHHMPFKMWLYPVPAIISILGWSYVFATLQGVHIAYGAATMALGMVAFLVVTWKQGRWPFGPAE